jgi:hypothetical protein
VFGGLEGMTTAHDLFQADSLDVLDYLYRAGADRRGTRDARATSWPTSDAKDDSASAHAAPPARHVIFHRTRS